MLNREIVSGQVSGEQRTAADWASLVWRDFVKQEIDTQDGCIDEVAGSGPLSFLTASGPCAYGWRFKEEDDWVRFDSAKSRRDDAIPPPAPNARDIPPIETVRIVAGGTPEEILALALASCVARCLDVGVVSGTEVGDQIVRSLRLMDAMFHTRATSAVTRILALPAFGGHRSSKGVTPELARDGLSDVPLPGKWLAALRASATFARDNGVFAASDAPVILIGAADQLAMSLLDTRGRLSQVHRDAPLFIPVPGIYEQLDPQKHEGSIGQLILEGDAVALPIALRRLSDPVGRTALGGGARRRRVFLVPRHDARLRYENLQRSADSVLAEWALGILADPKGESSSWRERGGDRLSEATHKAFAVWLALQTHLNDAWFECDLGPAVGSRVVDVRPPSAKNGCSFQLLDFAKVSTAELQNFLQDILAACNLCAKNPK